MSLNSNPEGGLIFFYFCFLIIILDGRSTLVQAVNEILHERKFQVGMTLNSTVRHLVQLGITDRRKVILGSIFDR